MYVHLSVCKFASACYICFHICPCIVVPLLVNLGLVIQPARFGEKKPLICRHHDSTYSNTSAMIQSLNSKSVTACNAHFDESSKLVALMTSSRKHYSNCRYVMSEFKQPLQRVHLIREARLIDSPWITRKLVILSALPLGAFSMVGEGERV
jgi:hypothetical protein